MSMTEKPGMGGFQVIVWQKRTKSVAFPALCRDGNTANLVLLPNACHGQWLSVCLIIRTTGYVYQMHFYANKNHNKVKIAGA